MRSRLILSILILTLAGLACNFPLPADSPLQSAPTAASPSPTVFVPPAATVTPTPLQARHYFFEEEFTGDFLGWTTLVTNGDPDLLDLRTQGGLLVFNIGEKNLNALSFFQGGMYKNVWIDLRVLDPGATEYAVNMICRYDKVDGWYQFEIFNSGLFNLYYMSWDEDLKPEPTLLTKGGSNAIRSDSNVLSMICDDRMLSLYINGQMAVSYEENQYALRAGQVGVGVSSFEEIPLVVKFDWMKLETP